MNKIEKLCEKFKLSESEIRSICAQEHMVRKVYPKKELKTINITFKGDSSDFIQKIAKALKVSSSAVIGGLLHERFGKK